MIPSWNWSTSQSGSENSVAIYDKKILEKRYLHTALIVACLHPYDAYHETNEDASSSLHQAEAQQRISQIHDTTGAAPPSEVMTTKSMKSYAGVWEHAHPRSNFSGHCDFSALLWQICTKFIPPIGPDWHNNSIWEY